MNVHVYTIRDGRNMLGNCSSVNGVWRDLKTARGIERRARQWARFMAKPGDLIICDILDPENIYRPATGELFRFRYVAA